MTRKFPRTIRYRAASSSITEEEASQLLDALKDMSEDSQRVVADIAERADIERKKALLLKELQPFFASERERINELITNKILSWENYRHLQTLVPWIKKIGGHEGTMSNVEMDTEEMLREWERHHT